VHLGCICWQINQSISQTVVLSGWKSGSEQKPPEAQRFLPLLAKNGGVLSSQKSQKADPIRWNAKPPGVLCVHKTIICA